MLNHSFYKWLKGMMRTAVSLFIVSIFIISFTDGRVGNISSAINKCQGKSACSFSMFIKRPDTIFGDSGEAYLERAKKKAQDQGRVKYNDKAIPILMYHSVEYVKSEPKNDLRVPKEKFREQMEFLKNNGYTTISMEELYEFFKGNKPIPEKSVVLTFDDGYLDNYTYALPVLKEFGLKATVFVVTDWVGTNNAYMTLPELREMVDSGFDVQSHTLDHRELNKLTYSDQLRTLRKSKEFLESKLNKKVITIAYPLGKFNKDTIRAVQEAGYSMAMKMVGGWARKDNGMYTLNRVYILASDNIKQFSSKISGSR